LQARYTSDSIQQNKTLTTALLQARYTSDSIQQNKTLTIALLQARYTSDSSGDIKRAESVAAAAA